MIRKETKQEFGIWWGSGSLYRNENECNRRNWGYNKPIIEEIFEAGHWPWPRG